MNVIQMMRPCNAILPNPLDSIVSSSVPVDCLIANETDKHFSQKYLGVVQVMRFQKREYWQMLLERMGQKAKQNLQRFVIQRRIHLAERCTVRCKLPDDINKHDILEI